MHIDLQNIINKLSISISNPLSMSDVQYEDEYDDVEKEFQKLQGVVPAQPDWDIVIEKSMIVLTEKARHLKIATYLFVALYKLYQLEGLLASLYILSEMMAEEGDDLYPNNKRKKTRPATLTWFSKFVSDWRSLDMVSISLDDLKGLDTSRDKAVFWYEQCHPKQDSQSILAIYDAFSARLKQAIIEEKNKKNELEKKQAELKKIQDEATKTSEIEEEIILESEPSLNEISFEEDTDHSVVPPLETNFTVFGDDIFNDNAESSNTCESFKDLRDNFVRLTLDKFESSPSVSEYQLKCNALAARTVLWSSAMYDNFDDAIKSSHISEDYLNIYRPEMFVDTFEYLQALENVFLENPFMLEIQYQISKTLEMLYKQEQNQEFYDYSSNLNISITQLLNGKPKLFDSHIDGRPCVPEHIEEWLWTDVFTEVSSQVEGHMKKLLPQESGDIVLDYIQLLSGKSQSVYMQIFWKLEAVKRIQGIYDDITACEILEKFLKSYKLNSVLTKHLPILKEAYNTLSELYEKAQEKDAENKDLENRKNKLVRKMRGNISLF